MKRELTAPEALNLYRSERASRLRDYLSAYERILCRLPVFRGSLVENLHAAATEWLRLVVFLLENTDVAGATPQDVELLQDDAHGLLYLRATLEGIVR